MTPASSDAPPGGAPTPDGAAGDAADRRGRHSAPALWMVLAAVLTAAVSARWVGASTGAMVLAGTLFVAAVARLAYRGRQPEGIAVRSTWADVVVLLGLAVSIGVLALSPGV